MTYNAAIKLRQPGALLRSGFSLVELCVMALLVALLAGGGLTYYGGVAKEARRAQVVEQLARLRQVLMNYSLSHRGKLPANMTEVSTATMDSMPIDPWDKPYILQPNAMRVVSGGPDGEVETPDIKGSAAVGDDLCVSLVAQSPSNDEEKRRIRDLKLPSESDVIGDWGFINDGEFNDVFRERIYTQFVLGDRTSVRIPVNGQFCVLVYFAEGNRPIRFCSAQGTRCVSVKEGKWGWAKITGMGSTCFENGIQCIGDYSCGSHAPGQTAESCELVEGGLPTMTTVYILR